MSKIIFSALLSLGLGVIFLRTGIPLLRKIKIKQPIYEYVKSHKEKNGTPTMGGLFFIISSILTYFIFFGFLNYFAIMTVVITLAFMCVGFLDDYLKIRFSKNQGLKAYQKIIFQLSIALLAGYFSYVNGLTLFNIPFTNKSIDLGFFTMPLICFVFVSITNSVNLTDGLDGLASSVCVIYLIFISLICYIQPIQSGQVLIGDNYYLIGQSACMIGGLLAFLCFNFNKASVFMGDTGSLALGGFLGCVSIFSNNSLFILVLGFVFVMSAVSVIIQVFYFKKTKKRVFLICTTLL